MLTLVTYPPAFGQPSGSPFCVKALYLLNLSGLQWQRKDTADPRSWPKGKLPALWVDDEIIGDSDNIRAWLEEHGAHFDQGLSDLDRATSRAFIRMAEEHMYFHVVMDRWGDKAVWPLVRDTYFAAIPTFLRKFITRGIRRMLLRGMDAQGLGRLTAGERLDRIEPDLLAITDRLWHGPFLFGPKPSAADASVAAMLGAMASTPGGTALSRRVKQDVMLVDYMKRVEAALG
ncbi:glutathione S-transferase family protein [uncultured Tateyamaria sp.]|uniref:glutathione S-transferase family protein n=1 Tax=uncultured Tateyamaria sp. TaxID=455651 RepID=UPI0026387667|nr:glutathione S-transferase family protein [uncultured Tateyamaria sp.]